MSDEQQPKTEFSDFMVVVAAEPDPKMRTLLTMIFSAFARLEKKFDLVMRDEAAIRALVLNGHADNHPADHDFIAEVRPLAPRIIAATEWVEERQRHGDMCPWGAAKQAEEQAAEAAANVAKVKQKYDLKTAIVTAIISIVAMGVASMVFGTHPL